MTEPALPKLTITYGDPTNSGSLYIIQVKLDDEPLGILQLLEVSHDNSGIPKVRIEQIIYSRKQFAIIEKMKLMPHVTYVPIFMDGKGQLVEQEDAWFLEDHPEFVEYMTGSAPK